MSEKSRRKQYGEIASALAGLDVFVAPAIMVDEALDIDEARSLERLAWLLEEAHTEAAKLKHGGWER